MSDLFKPYRIRNLVINNRFVRSATTTYYADDDGFLRDGALDIYECLAKGGVGLIIKGHLSVVEGKAHDGMAKISGDRHITRLKELTDRVHANNGKIVAQINHAGIQDKVLRVGPSEYDGDAWKARRLGDHEIREIIESFASAAERAVQAGFDGVQIHGAHGYLISQFLSPSANRRNDKWGGGLENRARLLVEVYNAVRRRVGNYPIMLKINSDDFAPNGFTVDESIPVIRKMAELGIDMVEISGGGFGRKEELRARAKHPDPKLSEVAFAGHAEKIRSEVTELPLALVNGFCTLDVMESVIERGLVDLVSMSRPFIRQPDLVKLLERGQKETSCTRCNACLGDDVFGKMLLECHL